ncbi:MAG: subfamily B ATP-binding cassette protein MsbA [Parasphingorhabdus sp.]|jgi:subfamily B ATP-binding cassette protein MsbA
MTDSQKTISAGVVYKRLLTHAWPYRWVFMVGVLGMFIGSAAEGSFAALLKPIMDDGFVNRDADIIMMTPFLLAAVFIIRGISGFVDAYCVQWVGRKVVFDLRALMFNHMLSLPASYYDQHSTSDLIAKLIFDVEQVAQAATTALRIFFKDTFLTLYLLGLLSWLSWKLTLIFIVIVPVIGFMVKKLSKRFRYTSTKIQDTMGDITHVAKEAFEGQAVVKVFDGYETEANLFDKVNRRNRRFAMRKAVVSAASVPAVMFVAGMAVSVIIYFAMGGGGAEIVSPGTFVAYLGAVMLMQAPIKRLARVNEIIQTGVAAANSVFNVLDLEREPVGGEIESFECKGDISFEDISFTYPGTDSAVLNNLSLYAKPGETIAIVGASGSGKSTIISLLLGFYTAQNGQIKLDGENIENLSKQALRSKLALVTQETFLFDGTLAGNITYGQASADKEKLKSVAETAGVLSFAEKFDAGLDSPVGERGGRLSGGQRQRVVIARALFKRAPILVLDEATSALDSHSELLIKQAITSLAGKRTIVIIAHRLSTVVNADRIYVMSDGEIVEAGSHDELLKSNGAYAHLHRKSAGE